MVKRFKLLEEIYKRGCLKNYLVLANDNRKQKPIKKLGSILGKSVRNEKKKLNLIRFYWCFGEKHGKRHKK
jgi:hypothetical protein